MPALSGASFAVGLCSGALAAVAYVVENAWQSWAAIQLHRSAGASLHTAAAAPTLISLSGGHAGPSDHGAATGTVVAIAYLGFVFGPALVGLAAAAASLPAALLGVAAVALLLAAASPALRRLEAS